MTKILCVGDIHATDTPPANCTDTYLDDILDMLRWVARFAQAEKVDAVVWAGDVFHHKAPGRNSHALILRLLEVVAYYREHDVELWIVAGNHDLSNDVLTTLHTKQPLGVLYAAGAHELIGWHPTLPLYGVPWQQDWTTNTKQALDRAFTSWTLDPWRFEPLLDDVNYKRPRADCLVVTHAPVYPPTQVARGVPFDLVPTSGPVSLSQAMGGEGSLYYGHIHEDHGIFTDGGVTFANMGAISRGSLHEYNVTRDIKVALWTDTAGFTEVHVPHKPASEVFRLTEAAEAKAEKLDLDNFLNRVGSASLSISSTASVISHLHTRTDVTPIVRDRAITFLEDADAHA